MPIYEFNCGSCKKPFQKLLPTMNWKGVVCPACGSDSVEKKLSRFAVVGASEGDFAGGTDTNFDSDGPACSGDPSNCGRCDDD